MNAKLEKYRSSGRFSEQQLEEIEKGIEQIEGGNVSAYADPKFTCQQMRQLRSCLIRGLNASRIASPVINHRRMAQLALAMEEGVDVDLLMARRFDHSQLQALRKAMRDGYDYKLYYDTDFNGKQMDQLYKGQRDGIDVSEYANSQIDFMRMLEIRRELTSAKRLEDILAKDRAERDSMLKEIKALRDEIATIKHTNGETT